MSEMIPENHESDRRNNLVDKPIPEMSQDEYVAWYHEYMKTVDEDNIMMISGVPKEVEDDYEAFVDFVTVFQQLKRQGLE